MDSIVTKRPLKRLLLIYKWKVSISNCEVQNNWAQTTVQGLYMEFTQYTQTDNHWIKDPASYRIHPNAAQ